MFFIKNTFLKYIIIVEILYRKLIVFITLTTIVAAI